MTYQQRTVRQTTTDPATGRTVVTNTAAGPVVDPAYPTNEVIDQRTVVTPSPGLWLRRLVSLIFGIIQTLIVLRIVLLLLNAREGNDIVRAILDWSQIFVAPFVGIFNVDAIHASGSVLDIAAIAALVGWTVLEWIVLWATNLFVREPTVV
ncbi:MAG TPA: hypothetical protein VKR30_00500 [Candidatus Limnocylindrales bacterium]|nr:hypothetical protein [Candidatus Limnocylindrales bacterium]